MVVRQFEPRLRLEKTLQLESNLMVCINSMPTSANDKMKSAKSILFHTQTLSINRSVLNLFAHE